MFLNTRKHKVHQAVVRVHETEAELEASKKGVLHAQRFWFGPEGIIWLCQKNDLDPYELLQLGVELDDEFQKAYDELMAVAEAE